MGAGAGRETGIVGHFLGLFARNKQPLRAESRRALHLTKLPYFLKIYDLFCGISQMLRAA